jgi:transcriptional regulator with XRE-family HTH domain
MPVSRAFSVVLRNLRTKRGLSQEALAEKAGLHPTYISLIERGIRKPTIDAAQSLAVGLGLTLSEMVRLAEALQKRGVT